MATVRDVAKLAGVSTATVSAVVNSSAYVSPPLVEKVKTAMDELDYFPNEIARSLKNKSTKTIGLIIPHISPFFTDLIQGVETSTNDQGFTLVLCSSNGSIAKEKKMIRMLQSKRVDGLIIAAVGQGEEYLQSCLSVKLPIVFVDRVPAPGDLDIVVSDNFQGAYDAVSHLIELGHRRIGAIHDRGGLYTSRERMAGFKKAFEDHNLPLDKNLLRAGNGKVEGAFKQTEILMELENQPTAIFTINNLTTVGVIKGLSKYGLSCPEDVSILGFDDVEWADFFSPRLTTVALPSFEIGAKAAELLFKRLSTKEAFPPKSIMLKTKLIIRDSCQKADSSSP